MKYGLVVAYTENLGDDVQSLAALQFYPKIDVLLHREFLNRVYIDDTIKAIVNGWFMYKPENWPPSSAIEPLIISIHIDPKIVSKLLSRKGIKYFKSFEPIGARDLFTKKVLERHGVLSYFSGCLSLTLDYKFHYLKVIKNDKSDYTLIVDLPPQLKNQIKRGLSSSSSFQNNIVEFTHNLFHLNHLDKVIESILGILNSMNRLLESVRRQHLASRILRRGLRYPIVERFKKVLKGLMLIANARCVITTRLHVALPLSLIHI